MRKLTIINICLILFVGIGIAFAANTKSSSVPAGFDRPFVIDKKLERDVATLSKRLSVLEAEVKKSAKKKSPAPIAPVGSSKKVAGLQNKVNRLEKQMSQLLGEITNLRGKVAGMSKDAPE